MATINPDEIPLDKIDAVIERLQKEKDARIDARVAAGEAPARGLAKSTSPRAPD